MTLKVLTVSKVKNNKERFVLLLAPEKAAIQRIRITLQSSNDAFDPATQVSASIPRRVCGAACIRSFVVSAFWQAQLYSIQLRHT